jgi:nucleoside-diphosphate-sugar epimerase
LALSPHAEADWADMNMPAEWADNVKYDRDTAYAKTKADTERLCYSEAEKHGFEAFGVMPCHVVGRAPRRRAQGRSTARGGYESYETR